MHTLRGGWGIILGACTVLRACICVCARIHGDSARNHMTAETMIEVYFVPGTRNVLRFCVLDVYTVMFVDLTCKTNMQA